MDPDRPGDPRRPRGFPRPRGDGPDGDTFSDRPQRVPPPARGWTPGRVLGCDRAEGSPARAGMDPARRSACAGEPRFPRPRGDGPLAAAVWIWITLVPPPARGWTLRSLWGMGRDRGSPARAGMDPRAAWLSRSATRFPRPRGDGPARSSDRSAPSRFPRPRGDGPSAAISFLEKPLVPPPARGWTARGPPPGARRRGSPARAGMDRALRCGSSASMGFPRPRGDGPLSYSQ